MCVTARHLGGSGGMLPRKFSNFRRSENAFSGHSWFSNDMIEMTSFLVFYLTCLEFYSVYFCTICVLIKAP